MSDFFSMIYEMWFQVYDSRFPLIFDTLYDESGYVQMGVSVLVLPLLLWILFYYVWKFPYGKLIHWVLWLVIVAVIVGCVSGIVSDNAIFNSDNQGLIDALADSGSGYEDYASNLPLQYALISGGLSVVMSFLYSLILKQKSN